MNQRDSVYQIILWAYPPHQPDNLIPLIRELINQVIGIKQDWKLLDKDNTCLPETEDGLNILEKEIRNNDEFNSFSILIASNNGLKLSLSLDAPRYVRAFNTMTLLIDQQLLEGEGALLDTEKIVKIFTEMVSIFKPFWGAVTHLYQISSQKYQERRLSFDQEKLPVSFHWINFFGQEMLARLGGRENLETLGGYLYQEIQNPLGAIYIIQKEPFKFEEKSSRELIDYIERKVDLVERQKIYRK